MNAPELRHDSHARLENIEASISRIDKTLADLSGAMVTLARVEERLASSHEKVDRLEHDVEALRDLLRQQTAANNEQDKVAASEQERVRWTERIVWALLTGSIFSAGYLGLFQ